MNCVPPKLHFMHYGSNLSYDRKGTQDPGQRISTPVQFFKL